MLVNFPHSFSLKTQPTAGSPPPRVLFIWEHVAQSNTWHEMHSLFDLPPCPLRKLYMEVIHRSMHDKATFTFLAHAIRACWMVRARAKRSGRRETQRKTKKAAAEVRKESSCSDKFHY
jgi:hypothetical protein